MYTEQDLACPATVTYLQTMYIIYAGIVWTIVAGGVWWWIQWWRNFWPLIVPPKV